MVEWQHLWRLGKESMPTTAPLATVPSLKVNPILAVLAYIKSIWPERALAAQKEITQLAPQ